MRYESDYLEHFGVKGQKWGVKNGPPYPLAPRKQANRLYKKMLDFEYGGIVKGKRVTEPEYYDIDFGKDYRTIPIKTMEKQKIGNCWDMVNYQHHFFKKNGIKDHSYMLVMDKGDDGYIDNVLTHTFSIFESKGNLYWFEQAWWTKRGIRKVKSYSDVIDVFKEEHGDHSYFVSTYNPDGLDKKLTDKQFFKIATRNVIEDHEK
jgi:hypothetical protein